MIKREHFQSIDALRFFAFLKVYLLHIPLDAKFPNFSLIKSGGGIGVSFFFVLSGFLISYLLFLEKANSNRIDLWNFYKRRAFRIWPLFFLMVLIVFFMPFDIKQDWGLHMVGGGYDFDWRYSFTFLENYKMIIEDQFPKTTPLSVFWSLCIEEHFYIVWGLLFYFMSTKNVLRMLVLSVVIAWLARGYESHFSHNLVVRTNDLLTNLDYFSCGGILAFVFVFYKDKLNRMLLKIGKLNLKFCLLAFVLILIFHNQLIPDHTDVTFIFKPTIIALVFSLIICLFVSVESGLVIKSKFLNFLGVRSYGLYVFHIISIHMLYQYCLLHKIRLDTALTVCIFMLVSFSLTVAVSMLSYRFFEKPILKLRRN
ncbi:MAG: acyltransferase [Flavobacteriia bacterium]|nr:acyltransferase [Flavobacteriia bacterium]NBY40751.1 acyltransferase [Flavobacteriia bacterium]